MNYNEIFSLMEKRFSISEKTQERFKHSVRVVDMALEIKRHLKLNLDEEKIKIAAILHDYAKACPEEEQLLLLSKYVDYAKLMHYKDYPSVIHSILGAYLVKDELGIDDKEIFEAIAYHTTGKVGMGVLSKLIYVSDACEEGRTHKYASGFRTAAKLDLDYAVAVISAYTLFYLEDKNLPIEPNTLDLYNYYEEYYDKK